MRWLLVISAAPASMIAVQPAPRFFIPANSVLNRVDAVFARANAYRLIYGENEDFAVAEFACARGFDDRINRSFDHLFVNDDLDLQLRHEFDFVFTAAIDLGVAFLPAEALYFTNRHPLHAERL